MAEHLQAPSGEAGTPVRDVERRLRALGTRARWLLITAAVAGLGSALIAAALSLGVVDYLLRLPTWFRAVLWAVGATALTVEVWHRVVPALRFRPTATQVALRLEQTEEGQRAGLGGVLTSGLELARENPTGTTGWMAEHVVQDAQRRFATARASSLLRPRAAGQSIAALGLCVACVALIALLVGPTLAGIGAARVLAPWAGAQWPKRTEVANATLEDVHPITTAIPLRAAIIRSEHAIERTRVWVAYRVLGVDSTPRRAQLTWQNRSASVTPPKGVATLGQIFERLIEPASLGLATVADGEARPPAELEYWFETADDQTEPARIKLVQPPSVVSASAKITPPAYVQTGPAKSAFVSGTVDLGPGNDQRAVVGPVLAGSHIEWTVRLNKTVPVPSARHDEGANEARREWLAAAMPGAQFGDDMVIAFEGREWTLGWTAAKSLRIPVAPMDEYGLKATEEPAFSIDVTADNPPTAAVIEPREDESVLATAVVPVTGEGRDDVGVSTVALARQIARAAAGSIGATPEATEAPVTIATRDTAAEPEPGAGSGFALQSTVGLSLDLATLGLKPGEELWLTAVVTDNYELNGQRHDPIRSAPRRLRIIREEDLIDQIRAELGAVRKVAIRLDEDQGELQKPVARGAVTSEDRRRQSGISQRTAQQRETLKRLADRARRNRLKDESMDGLLSDVDSLLKDAAEASERAGSAMDAAAQQSPDPERAELAKPRQEQVAKDQDAVRDSLARLADMLDKGEDSWAVSRTLQRLAQQQRDLKTQTERAGEHTMGKKPEDLSTQEKAELAEIAERQRRLGDQTRQAIDQLDQRSRQLQDADKAQADAMKQAAQRGREKQVPQKMDDAAKQAEQNQTSQASAQQQDAAEALDQMLQDMEQAQKNRDASLRRLLADLLQSITQLIQDQQAQIEALAGAAPTAAYAGLDGPMIALNQNTLGVADKAHSDRQAARIAELIDRAGKAQESAITALRATPVAVEEADQGERESLRLLGIAKAEAEKLRDDASKRDARKKRQELRQSYREALEEQAAIKGETDPFIGKEIDRRDRIKVRGIGERQDGLRQKLADVKSKTAELSEAGVFEFAHQRLDLATGVAGKRLRAGQPDKTVQRNQDSTMRLLKGLIDALDEQLQRDDEFREANGGGGGSGGQGGQGGQKEPALPPLAELRLLRAMQAEAADTTRAIDDAKGAAPEELPALGDLQRNLAKRGDELMKKMQDPSEGGGILGGSPDKPKPPKGGDGG